MINHIAADVSLGGRDAPSLEDVTSTPAETPPPGRTSPRVVVVGAGFGGLGTARALLSRGVTDVTVLERGDSVGGVWRDNTYPKAACDVPSPLYSWSWAPNPRWGRRYSEQPEILDYIRRTAQEEGLLPLVRTGTTVLGAEHVDGAWRVRTAPTGASDGTEGPTYDADVLVLATGQLSEPVVPRIPGLDSFEGPAFHSAQWRHDVDLTGKRVAVVGTGASAVQLVPGIVDRVGSMTVFQRSAPYVVPKPDQAYSSWHHRLFEKRPGALAAERRVVYWLSERLNGALVGSSPVSRPFLAALKGVWRAHLRRQVPDAGLRRKLVPDYDIGCKRVLFSNEFYPALARPHVEVVTEPVTSVEPTGVVDATGRLHEVDVIVWGTGFAATDFLRGMKVSAPDGRSLDEVWADGARAHLGLTVPGFPNFFTIYGPNTNLGGSSIIGMLEAQADYVSQVVAAIREGRHRAVAPRPEVWDDFDREVQRRLATSAWAGCDSWYTDGRRITTNWPGLVQEYRDRVAQVDWSELEEVS